MPKSTAVGGQPGAGDDDMMLGDDAPPSYSSSDSSDSSDLSAAPVRSDSDSHSSGSVATVEGADVEVSVLGDEAIAEDEPVSDDNDSAKRSSSSSSLTTKSADNEAAGRRLWPLGGALLAIPAWTFLLFLVTFSMYLISDSTIGAITGYIFIVVFLYVQFMPMACGPRWTFRLRVTAVFFDRPWTFVYLPLVLVVGPTMMFNILVHTSGESLLDVIVLPALITASAWIVLFFAWYMRRRSLLRAVERRRRMQSRRTIVSDSS